MPEDKKIKPESDKKEFQFKRIIVYFLILVFLVFIVSLLSLKKELLPITTSFSKFPGQKMKITDWEAFKSSDLGFELEYPANFSIKERLF